MLSGVQYTHATEIFAFRKRSQSWICMSARRLIEAIFWTYSSLTNFTDRGISLHGRMAQKSLQCPNHAAGTPAGSCTTIGFFQFFASNCNFVTVWVRCPAWMNDSCAGLLPRGVLPSRCPGQSCKSKVLGFYFFSSDVSHLAWWSPYMLVGGISMPLGHPSYWKHKFTLIQNNIFPICI